VGENGTGKSTILNIVMEIWNKNYHSNPNIHLKIVPKPFDEADSWLGLGQFTVRDTYKGTYRNGLNIDIQFIKTFDAPFYTLTEKEIKRKPYIKSTLDEELENCISQYVDYQLNKSNEIIFNKIPAAKAFAKKLLFIETINRLFQITGKVMDVKDNKLAFKLKDETKIHWYDLSSGEKQLLIILLTVLCQDEKPAILMMDEPEISLHLEWQKELIKIIRTINPNCQLIIVTHSPGIIMNGWFDKVLEINDILKSQKQAIAV
jgi:energy-coupling factor transporter ATP-binding protein EcfA2